MATNQVWPPPGGEQQGDSEAIYSSVPVEVVRPKMESSDDETDLYVDAFSTVPVDTLERQGQGQGQLGNAGMDLQSSSNGLLGEAATEYDIVKAPLSLYGISKPVADMLEPHPLTSDVVLRSSEGQSETQTGPSRNGQIVYDLASHSDFPVYELAKNVARSPDEKPEELLPELKIVEEDPAGTQGDRDNFYEAVCTDDDAVKSNDQGAESMCPSKNQDTIDTVEKEDLKCKSGEEDTTCLTDQKPKQLPVTQDDKSNLPLKESENVFCDSDYKKDDKFIYDLAGPVSNNVKDSQGEEKALGPVVEEEVAPKPLCRKESLQGKLSTGASGVYEEITLPETLTRQEKSSLKSKVKKKRSSREKTQKGNNKWDTLKRGIVQSQGVPGYPPIPYEGTLYTDVYYPGDDDDYENSLDGGSTDSEFDTISDQEEAELAEIDAYTNKPLPKPPPKTKAGLLGRMKIKGSMIKKSDKPAMEESSPCLPVKLDTKRHPPPEMPAPPGDLTETQLKKRKVIESIIYSEKSYIDSLDRVVNVYRAPLLGVYNLDTKEGKLKDVFNKTQEILNYHLMFQLELAECVKNWDTTEKIGDIFTASFSRAMVVDVYSDYVNKFSMAMEEIKRAQNAQPALRKFLQEQEQTTSDRLSIFGLMVKPVQRFPQFIMFMQDLLKYTPPNHHDRCALQRALTELENVAHRLNESKRDSEQYLEAKRLLKKLGKNFPERSQKLLRQDDFEQMTKANNSGEIQMKKRRLILMDDCLILIGVTYRDTEDRRATEQLKVKSYCALVNLELKDSSISPDMQSNILTTSRRTSIQTKAPQKPEDDPFHLYNDLSSMMHDLSVLGKIGALVSSLQNTYESLSEDLVIEVTRDLQQMIQVKDQQLQLLNSCTINVHDTFKNVRYTFQTSTPEMKQEWCKEFLMAKFALEPPNNPAWLKGEETNSLQPAVFMKSVCVDMPRNYTKMKCAVPVFLSAPGTIDIGIQHLWVVMTTEKRTQVALVSTQSTKPALVESFQAMDVEAVAVEMVQGYATVDTEDAFVEDTVWMSTTNCEIVVFRLFNEAGRRDLSTTARKPRTRFYCHGIAMVIRAMDDRVFVGCNNGNLVIYDRNEEGKWNFRDPTITVIDSVPIRSILVMDEEVWLSCRDYVYIVQCEENTYSEKIRMSSTEGGSEISEMVRSGVGLWVSYKDQSRVCLFHIETKENLQEVNVKGAVERMVSSCPTYAKEKSIDTCFVTSLMTSRGYLWIGTNVGIILTVSLPRLKDGVPRYWDKPWVSCHAHNGPVRLLIPVYCDTINLWQFVDGANQMAGNESCDISDLNSDRRKSSSSSVEPESLTRKDSLGVQVLPKDKGEILLPQNVSLTSVRDEDSDTLTSKSPSRRYLRHPQSSLPFRKELLETVKKKRLGTVRSSNLLDKVSSEDEVSLYYSDLMTFDEGSDSSKNSDLSDRVQGKESTGKSNDVTPAVEETEDHVQADVNVQKSHKELKPKKSFSLRKTLTMQSKNKSPNVRSSMSLRLPPGEQNGPRMKAISTLSKRNCNAVIVISGGDGYLDWKRPPLEQKEFLRNDESSLMMWMYKF